MQIKDILLEGNSILKENNIENPNLKSRILLSNLLEKSKEYLIIHDTDEIDEKIKEIFFKQIDRLKENEPIQYIANHQEFMGFDFYVDENVLIPQPDTENLVEEILMIVDKEKCKYDSNYIRILDLCTGSGAIAISLSKILNSNKILIYGSDISENAIKIAEENATRNLARVIFMKSDLFNDIDEAFKFDIIVSNPPYIETDIIASLSEEVKYEPILALDGGKDGLKYYKEIVENAKKYLNPNGFLAFEIGYNQKESVENILKENKYINIYSKKDLSGNDRIVIAQYQSL